MSTSGRTKIVAYDAAEGGFLGFAWGFGTAVLAGADYRVPARSWAELVDWLAVHGTSAWAPVDLQVWSHGAPGAPLIARRRPNLGALAEQLPTGSTVWWRACDVHGGPDGHAFARDVAARGLTSVGHCAVVSWPWPLEQREICALRPGESVWWSESGSELRSCGTLRMTVPSFAYAPGGAR